MTTPGTGHRRFTAVIRIISGLLAAVLFGLVLMMFNDAVETTAAVRISDVPRAVPELDQPVRCQAVSGSGAADYAVTTEGSTREVDPLYGDTTDIIAKCSDARASQVTRMLVWSLPILVLAMIAVIPRYPTSGRASTSAGAPSRK